MKDLTNALRQYQVFGVPNFIRSDQNAGFPYPYPKGAFCIFNDTINGPRIFQSLIADNVASPVDTSAWRWIDGTSTGVTQQNGAVFDSEVETGDIVYWNAGDGNYSRALANGGAAQTAIGIADLIYGRVVQFGFSDLFTALTPGSAYYLSSSLPGKITSTAVPGNAILMGVAITATSLNFNPQLGRNQIPAGTIVDWGGDSTNIPFGWAANDNSLYPIAGHPEAYAALGLRWGAAPAGFFRVPGKGSRVVIGAGQSAGLSAYVAGQVGGAEMAALLAVNNGSHAHQYNTKSGVAAQSGDSTLCWTGDAAATTGSSGSGTPFSILQPYIVFQSITKLQ
jgi:microcystin-dependent protein